VPIDGGKRNLPTERLSACVDYAAMTLRASHSSDGPLDLIQVHPLQNQDMHMYTRILEYQ
jgi:hypothetical protein